MLGADDLRPSGWELYAAVRDSCEETTRVRLDEALHYLGEPLRREALLHLLRPLNREQLMALLHRHEVDGPLLILAGAGSGKTAVLTRRVVALLLAGADPQSLFVATFTNKAAGEMRERVTKLLAELQAAFPGELGAALGALAAQVEAMWIGTFHSACLKLLKAKLPGSPVSNLERLGYKPGFKVMEPVAAKALIETAMNEAGPAAVALGLDAVADGIERARNELKTPAVLREQAKLAADRVVADVLERYQALKKARRQIDFTDIISFAVELLEHDPAVAEFYRARFRYVLIDEYQDTNFAQYVLARQLSAGRPAIFVVGDDDQSIYGWRGADIRNLIAFREDYPDARIVKLTRNYRSTRTIITAANRIFAGTKPAALRKVLEPVRTDAAGGVLEGEKIALFVAEDEHDEADFCAFVIKAEVARGRRHGDFAIFYRTNEQARAVREGLERAGLPAVECGDHRFFAMREIDNTLACLRLLEVIAAVRLDGPGGLEPAVLDDAGRKLAQLLKLPRFALGAEDQAALDHWLEPWRALVNDDDYGALAARLTAAGRETLDRFIDGFYRLLNLAAGGDLLPLLDQVWGQLGYTEQRDDGGARGRALAKSLGAFRALVEAWVRAHPPAPGFEPLRWFLIELEERRRDPQAVVAGGDSAVFLMTLHAAKGLEFPVVFFLGLEDGLCPLQHPSEKELDAEARRFRYEEELRLFYVGLTRAEEKLYLLRTRRRQRYGRTVALEPSPFLKLLPPGTVVRGDARGSGVGRVFQKLGDWLNT